MYLVRTKEQIYPDEPAIGSITHVELIEEPGEGFGMFIDSWNLNGYSDIIIARDEFTGEDIELQVMDYFKVWEIKILRENYGDI